jgi:multicomponent K+:H+ antiporter subunit G
MVDELPVWAAILVSVLVLAGAVIALLGSIGLAKLHSFYERLHAPTLGSSLGTFLILFGSVLYFSISGHRLLVHEILIFLFVSITTPVTLMLLARAALYRDRAEKNGNVPDAVEPKASENTD